MAKLTIIPSYCLAAFHDATGEATSAHAAENSVGLDTFRKLVLNLVHHARVPLPQKRMVVGGDHHTAVPLVTGEPPTNISAVYDDYSRVGFRCDGFLCALQSLRVAGPSDVDLRADFTHEADCRLPHAMGQEHSASKF